jgi:SAM-dependent methyltransferase
MPPQPEQTSIDAEAFNSFEARGWARAAGGYHRFFAPITTRLSEPLLDAARVGPGTRLLDVASGPGYVAAAAHDRGATVTGIDVAAEMVALAQSLQPGIRFVRGDAERLPFENGSFDAAVANFAVLHIGRPERAAAELSRVLAPRGRVALSVWDRPERARLLGLLVDAVAQAGTPPLPAVPAGPDFFRFSDECALADLLLGAGLDDVRVETVAFRHRLAGADELWDGLLQGTVRMSALVHGQDGPTRRRIRATFDALAAEHAVHDGALELPVSVKLASAEKAR